MSMNDRALPRIAGVFLLAALTTNMMAFFIGTSRGLAPPPTFDFGDRQQLERLSAESGAHLFPLTLSVLSPVLAIPAGLGIYHVLRAAGWPALFGVVMFFIGMIFVVLLDVLELLAIARVAPAYGAAPDFARPSIQALGGTIDSAIDVLGYVGHFFCFGLAQLAWGIAIIKVPGISNWLGGLSFIPGILIGWLPPLIAIAGVSAAPVIGVGIIAFLTWLIGMTVVLLRWKPSVSN
jgi:hypothetical protein